VNFPHHPARVALLKSGATGVGTQTRETPKIEPRAWIPREINRKSTLWKNCEFHVEARG